MGSGVGMASYRSDCLRSLRSNAQLSTRCNLCASGSCREDKQLLEGGRSMNQFVQRVEEGKSLLKRVEEVHKRLLIIWLVFLSMETNQSLCNIL